MKDPKIINILETLFNPVALFYKEEEFIVVVKDEKVVKENINKIHNYIDDEVSLMVLTKEEYEKLKEKDLGERLF